MDESRSFTAFLANPIFLSVTSSLLMAQFIKAMVTIFRKPSVPLAEILGTFFWRTGGMPSSHSALVVSLATSIGFKQGIASDLFVFSLAFALVVVRDALGVRRAAGQQAKVLNLLGRDLSERFGIPYRPVKEIHGHRPAEVAVGSALGFALALAFSLL